MTAQGHDLREDGQGGSRALEDLRRAARVLGFADEDFTRILSAAVQAGGGTEIEDAHLVEQVKKRLALHFHSR